MQNDNGRVLYWKKPGPINKTRSLCTKQDSIHNSKQEDTDITHEKVRPGASREIQKYKYNSTNKQTNHLKLKCCLILSEYIVFDLKFRWIDHVDLSVKLIIIQ